MNAQRPIDPTRVKDYRSLAEELCEVYYPASKTTIADVIGVSQKTIYNMVYGEPVGVYTRKRLARFMEETFGLKIVNLKDKSIKLTPASVNITGNTIKKSNVAGRDILGDNKQLEFLQNYVRLLEEENKRLKELIK